MAKKRLRQQDLISALRELPESLGRTPTERQANSDPHASSHGRYVNWSGSWRKALEEAEIPLDPKKIGYDRKILLDHLRDLAGTLSRALVLSDLEAADGSCGATYDSHFGSWSAALVEAGLAQASQQAL